MLSQVVPLPGSHYRTTNFTGTIAAGAGANSEIWQFRWTAAAPLLCAVQKIFITSLQALTGFTAGFFSLEARIARAWSAAGTGGGTVTLTTNNQKMRTAHATSQVGEIRVSTTAALGAGTKTLDANPINTISGNLPTTANIQVIPATITQGGGVGVPLYEYDPSSGESPLVFAAQEGVVVRGTVPATGTWAVGVRVHWAEASVQI